MQKTSLEFAMHLIHFGIAILSILVNLLLTLIVFRNTPASFSAFGIMIKFHAFVDFYTALSCSAALPRIIPVWYFFTFQMDLASISGLHPATFQSQLFSPENTYSILASLVFRRLIIQGKPLTSRHAYEITCGITLPMPTILMIAFFVSREDDIVVVDLMNTFIPWYNATVLVVTGHENIRSISVIAVIINSGVLPGPVYMASLYLRSLILAAIARQSDTLSERTRKSHRKFVLILTAQASLPILTALSLVTFFLGFFDVIHHPALEASTVMIGQTSVIFSPLIVLYHVDHYRRAAQFMFRGGAKINVSQISNDNPPVVK